MRKPVFGVSDQAPHKPGCKTTQDGWRLEISYIGEGLYYLCNENKGIFVFAYAKSQFSHDVAYIVYLRSKNKGADFSPLFFAYAKSKFSHDTAQNQLLVKETGTEL